jgi:hypothetical protein
MAMEPVDAVLPLPAAARIGRPRWLDPRLVAGVLLVLLSVALGARIVAAADDTYRVWALTRDLGPSTALQGSDLVARSVRLSGNAARYVAADGAKPVGWVLTRAVGRDELLPRAALVRGDDADLREVSLRVERVTSQGLRRGSVVDVYSVPTVRAGSTATAAPPTLVLPRVTVADDVGGDSSRFGSGGSDVGVVLRVPTADVTRLLDAAAHGQVHLVRVQQ